VAKGRKGKFKVELSEEDPRSFRIEVITPERATGRLKRSYRKSLAEKGYVGTPALLLSTRPELRSVLGSFYAPEMEEKRRLSPKVWEMIMVVVAGANQCQYCATTHSYNAERYLGESRKSMAALLSGDFKGAGMDERTTKLLEYARKLTLRPHAVTSSDIQALRDSGYNDAEILEATVVTCSCNATNRLVSALSGTSFPELVDRYSVSGSGAPSAPL
jgi:uncharacterized peroxidase-related enzyme